MPSIIQKRLYNTVQVFWLDKERLMLNVLAAVHDLTQSRKEVKRVILFGSIAENRGLPSSDVDVLVEVDASQHRFLDRSVHFQKYFENIGLGVDLFVYTEEETRKHTIPLANSALKTGKILFKR